MPAKKKAAEASASQEEDISMADTAMVENGTPEAEDEITVDDHRIRIVSFIWPADLSYTCWSGTAQLPGSSETAASFEFKDEDHTLGNALRYIIMKKYVCLPRTKHRWLFLEPKFMLQYLNKCSWLFFSSCSPDVEFCGYSIPHPSEALMNIRIQTYGQYGSYIISTQLTAFIEGTTAVEALEKGFDDLMDLCDVVVDKFVEAREAFEDQMKE
jgi:DNA-directed RNA polymerases I and III subunit RPAC2